MSTRSDQRDALKVATLLLAMQLAFMGVESVGKWAAKPVTAGLLAIAAGGPATYDCLNSEIVKRERATAGATGSSAKTAALNRQLNMLRVAVTIMDAGLLYLFSYAVVRLCRRGL